MNPAHGLLGVDEVHGGGLLCVDGDGVGSAQRGGLDVLGVGYQEVRMPIYRVLNADGSCHYQFCFVNADEGNG